MTTIGQLRRSRNVAAVDLADKLGVAPDLLNHWERGRRKWPQGMEQTAREYLLALPEEPYTPPRHRHYLVCVQDTSMGLVLLHFHTSIKRKIPDLVHRYYQSQAWNTDTIGRITVFLLGAAHNRQPHIGTMHYGI